VSKLQKEQKTFTNKTTTPRNSTKETQQKRPSSMKLTTKEK
ncbi:5193_t:CDS:1, partial [Gigaspora rosea]